jgi:glycosyltransferase involved in cell wall biosynthesis
MPSTPAPRALVLLTELFANGGIQRFNQTLLSSLVELGVACEVLSMHDTEVSIRRNPLPESVHAVGYGGSRYRFAVATLRAVWQRRYDWIIVGHINLLPLSIALLATRPWMRAQTLLIAHGIEVWYRIGWSRRLALSKLSKILCVSGYTRQRILEQAPALAPERLTIFPNALSQTWSSFRHPISTVGPPGRFVLSVTRLHKGDRYKGVITVIEAMSMLEDSTLRYVIVGDGNDRPFLERVAARFGVADRVHFLSGITDTELVDLYVRCEAFVLPSGKEGFGIVFLEAMFFGAPVIAAAEKGALDVVFDGETGLLVRFGDPIVLRKAIDRLSADASLRERLRRAGNLTVTGDGPFTYSRFLSRSAAALGIPAKRAA